MIIGIRNTENSLSSNKLSGRPTGSTTVDPVISRTMVWVHCAQVPETLPERTVGRYIDALSESHRSALVRRLSNGTGMESLIGLALLANLLAPYTLPSLRCLRWTPLGKPVLPDGPDFSITHSGGFVACAVASRGLSVGIDLEPADRARPAAVRRIAAADERMALENGSVTATELWVAKEAVLKAAGAGLADIRRVHVRSDVASFDGSDFYWRRYRLKSGLLLAIATCGNFPSVAIHWPSAGSLFG